MIRDYTCKKCGYESHNDGLKFTVRYQAPLDELMIICPYCGYGWIEKCHKHKAETRPEGQVTPKAGGTMMKRNKDLAKPAAIMLVFSSVAVAWHITSMVGFVMFYARNDGNPNWIVFFLLCCSGMLFLNLMLDAREILREIREAVNAR